jgi:hypothetical protein
MTCLGISGSIRGREAGRANDFGSLFGAFRVLAGLEDIVSIVSQMKGFTNGVEDKIIANLHTNCVVANI